MEFQAGEIQYCFKQKFRTPKHLLFNCATDEFHEVCFAWKSRPHAVRTRQSIQCRLPSATIVLHRMEYCVHFPKHRRRIIETWPDICLEFWKMALQENFMTRQGHLKAFYTLFVQSLSYIDPQIQDSDNLNCKFSTANLRTFWNAVKYILYRNKASSF